VGDILLIAKDEGGQPVGEVRTQMTLPAYSNAELNAAAQFLGIFTREGEVIQTVEIHISHAYSVYVDDLVLYPAVPRNRSFAAKPAPEEEPAPKLTAKAVLSR